MAFRYGFFNSKNVNGVHDRTYNAEDITSYFDKIIGNGVFYNPANNLQIVANSAMSVICKPGRGWIDGFFLDNDADYILDIEPADVTLNRIDRIVFKLDKTNREMTVVVKKGENATNPEAPAIIRNENIKEYSLATIYIGKQVTSITQANITDTRLDSNVCGKVAVLVEQIDTSDLYDQWNDAYLRYYEESTKQFNTWFEELKNTLATAVMLRQYSNVYTTTEDGEKYIPITAATYTSGLDILKVFINGIRLNEPEDYLVNNNTIILTNAIAKNTPVIIEILKNVDGTDAAKVVDQVVDLEARVTALEEYIYNTTRSQ